MGTRGEGAWNRPGWICSRQEEEEEEEEEKGPVPQPQRDPGGLHRRLRR